MKNHELYAFCKWNQNYSYDKLAETLNRLGFDGVDLPCRTGAPINGGNVIEE